MPSGFSIVDALSVVLADEQGLRQGLSKILTVRLDGKTVNPAAIGTFNVLTVPGSISNSRSNTYMLAMTAFCYANTGAPPTHFKIYPYMAVSGIPSVAFKGRLPAYGAGTNLESPCTIVATFPSLAAGTYNVNAAVETQDNSTVINIDYGEINVWLLGG